MFVALRDIRFARGRFALMGAVVALITLLVVLLSGLTAGLADQSTSAVRGLSASHVAFGTSGDDAPEESYADSTVTEAQLDAWRGTGGVEWAEPLALATTRAEFSGGASSAVALLAAPAGGHLAPEGVADGVVVGRDLADEYGLEAGATLTVAGTDLTVADVADTGHHSHLPVVWADIDTWRDLDPRTDRGEAPDAPVANVIAAGVDSPDAAATADDRAGTVSVTRDDSLTAIGSFSSENGSLVAMQGFLYAISALVVGAFLTVWTIQRAGDVAILKALGGSTRYLLRDALAQAIVVLVSGAALGGAAGAALGAAAASAVPFELNPATTLLPVGAMVALGMIGAVLAVRRVTSVDPLTALGGVR
ncbi:ABC transporter permease [Nocardiopsis sp. EMB25]|uniref:ABC transporter permease n=1 Tax=Nocardiopsis sp. EMB25 TaxID=2835867 RepID=UPI002284E3DE|nr:ABC transporter permease [Nocardiopsis sp. EMB25]MCY9785346.1 ABC transporter permease [Nocardiopsis sp. EMB25]